MERAADLFQAMGFEKNLSICYNDNHIMYEKSIMNCPDDKKRMRFSFSCDAYERAFQTAQYIIAGTDPNHPTRIYFQQSSPSECFKMSCYNKAGRKVLIFGTLRPVQGNLEDMVENINCSRIIMVWFISTRRNARINGDREEINEKARTAYYRRKMEE